MTERAVWRQVAPSAAPWREVRWRRPAGGAVVAWLLLLGLHGCAANPHGQTVAFLRADEHTVAAGQYVVMPPDAVTIHAPVAPEVDGVTRQVRPDGKITLRLLGEVDVAGLTTEQIAEKLRAQLARYYVEPEVAVDVVRYGSQFIYVFGEVVHPGRRIYTGRDTLLSVLAEARPTFLAWRSRVRVVRPAADEAGRKVIIVNLDQMVRGGQVEQNVLLQPGDVIEVPPTPLAWAGLRVRELLFPITPVVEAYEAPARAVDAHRIYEDEWGRPDEPRRRTFSGFP